MGWWKHILKEQIKLANKVCINCHPSFLPFSRGKHYYFWNFVDNLQQERLFILLMKKLIMEKYVFKLELKEWEDNAFSMVKKSRKALINLYKKI